MIMKFFRIKRMRIEIHLNSNSNSRALGMLKLASAKASSGLSLRATELRSQFTSIDRDRVRSRVVPSFSGCNKWNLKDCIGGKIGEHILI